MFFQVSQVHPVLRGREERREIGDEKERRENEEPKEIEVLWDHQEKTGSKESWDLQGPKVIQDSKGKKGTQGPLACRERKESLVNRFQLLLLLFPQQTWL